MVFDEKTKKKAIIFFVMFLLVILLLYSWVANGLGGVRAVFSGFVKYALIFGFILLVILIAYKLFFSKTQINLVENDRKSIIQSGMLSKSHMLKDLYFTGDKEHGESKIGKIIGYCQIQSYEKAEEGEAIPEDCFVFKTQGFPFNLFEDPKVFRCYPSEHSQLIGDVRIYAISPIQKYGYYFPNHTFLNIARIDESVIKEAHRGLVFEFLKNTVRLTDKASGLDSEQKKDLDFRKLLKIPSSLGEQESRGG